MAQVHYWSVLNAPHGGTTAIDGTEMSDLIVDFFQATEFAQPRNFPPVKPDMWQDPGERDPLIAGAIVLVCFCCVFCVFCRSGGLKGMR